MARRLATTRAARRRFGRLRASIPSSPRAGRRWCGRPGTSPTCRGTASRVQRITFDGEVRDEFRGTGAIQQMQNMPDGSGICVRDDTGWLNLWHDDAAARRRAVRARRADVVGRAAVVRGVARRASGWRSPATSTGSAGCASSTWRPAKSIEVGRGVHGQLIVGRRSGRRPAVGCAHADPDRRVRRGHAGSGTVLAVGPVTAWDVVDLPEPELVERRARRRRRCTRAGTWPATGARCAGSTAGRPTSGASSSCRASPTGGRRDGTCSCPTRGARPATAAPTSRRCAASGAGSTSTTRRRSWPRPHERGWSQPGAHGDDRQFVGRAHRARRARPASAAWRRAASCSTRSPISPRSPSASHRFEAHYTDTPRRTGDRARHVPATVRRSRTPTASTCRCS